MLVDLTPIESERIRCVKILKETLRDIPEEEYWRYIMSYPQANLETGIYHSFTGNLLDFLFEETSNQEFGFNCKYWCEFDEKNDNMFTNSYGVADNIEQIKEYFKKQIQRPDEKYFITIHYIYQEKECNGSGWRWHKNGPYIGNLEPKCEYFNDEDFGQDFLGYLIDFHCYKLKNNWCGKGLKELIECVISENKLLEDK